MSAFISVLLSVKNGLPHLKLAIESVRRQTYRHFELIVQDGVSTDGSLEYLRGLSGIPGLSLESAPDRGIGHGFTRCMARARGDLVCILSSDEYLEDDALERGVGWYQSRPDAVVINGAVRLTDADDQPVQIFVPQRFSLLGHVLSEVVLSFSGLLNRAKLGADLFYDQTLKTCPDYDFWIRLGCRFPSRDFVTRSELFKTARADRASMSFRVESFDQFCQDKLFFLNRFLDDQPASPLTESVRASATAGIFLWAAESVFNLEGSSPAFVHWCRQAAVFDVGSARLAKLSERTQAFTIDETTGEISVPSTLQRLHPPADAETLSGALDLTQFKAIGQAKTTTRGDGTVDLRTSHESWAYAALLPLSDGRDRSDSAAYWARVDIEVLEGQVGVGLLVGDDLLDEQMLSASIGRTTRFVRISRNDATGILLRNGALRHASAARLFDVSLQRA